MQCIDIMGQLFSFDKTDETPPRNNVRQKEGAKTAYERFVVIFPKPMSNTQHPDICYPLRVAAVGAWLR